MNHTLFIGDLHLDPTHQEAVGWFLHFLQHDACNADALYILGDFFEVWIGDDDETDFAKSIISALRKYTDQGIPTYFMHGNRDFLIGKRFAKATGITLLKDPTCIDLYGTKTLLMHGDTLCTDDKAYQKARRRLRNRFIQWLFCKLPLAKRQKIAANFRKKSQAHTSTTATDIMDVNQQTVQEMMDHYQCQHLIHGHTHRPCMHEFQNKGTTYKRTVLASWHTKGSALRCTENEMTMYSL